MLKFKTSCAVLAYLSSNLLNEVGLSLFRYFEVGLRVCDIVLKKLTFAISSPDEFLYTISKRSGIDDNFTCKLHHACLSFISVHQIALPLSETFNCSFLLIYQPRRDERLSWPGWLTYCGRFTHISGHPSTTGRAQDRESSPAENRRSATEPRNQQPSQMWSRISQRHRL